MIYKTDRIDTDLLRQYVLKAGFKVTEFCKEVNSKKGNDGINYFGNKNIGLSKILKICNLLNIHFDDLFISRNSDGLNPIINGNGNIQNSTIINHDITSLRAENSALKEVNSMLKKDKEDLGRRLDKVLDFIRKSDGTILKEDVKKK